MKPLFSTLLLCISALISHAQEKKTDTVVVELAKTSKVILTIGDRSDLPTLKVYDYQALFRDIFIRLEEKEPTPYFTDTIPSSAQIEKNSTDNEEKPIEQNISIRYRKKGTRQSFNIDLGTNNYVENGKFPDENNALYAVRPWGSWYVGLSSIQRTHLLGKFFLEWGLGVSWYNFKFQNERTRISRENTGVVFSEDVSDLQLKKSKLTASYINASFVPMVDFGRKYKKTNIFDGSRFDFKSSRHSSGFRMGVGAYAGYRINSYSKIAFKENGNKQRDRDHNNFYLNNIRYGVRLQVGFRDTDLFFNYDLNDLFVADKGPKLNAFTLGVIF